MFVLNQPYDCLTIDVLSKFVFDYVFYAAKDRGAETKAFLRVLKYTGNGGDLEVYSRNLFVSVYHSFCFTYKMHTHVRMVQLMKINFEFGGSFCRIHFQYHLPCRLCIFTLSRTFFNETYLYFHRPFLFSSAARLIPGDYCHIIQMKMLLFSVKILVFGNSKYVSLLHIFTIY